jgi:acetyltransferase-like isoleucine patch superfamily enzyme
VSSHETLLKVIHALRAEMKAKWNRFVPSGELLEDRWTRGKNYGFGEGSNIYDSASVLGDVTVGKNCWIGPNVHLDGSGGLTIGDHVTVGVGSVLFTHSTTERDLSGGAYPMQLKPTNIGDHVFMAPYCIIEMGADIGHHSVLMSHCVVKHPVPPYSIVHGNPAKVIGSVVMEDGKRPSMRFTREGMELIKPAKPQEN